jgi:hypothetical protein
MGRKGEVMSDTKSNEIGAFDEMWINVVDKARFLLPDPSPEVVGDLVAEVRRLRDALGVIARNVDAGAVHISWCSDYARRVLGNKEICGGGVDGGAG